jgi:NAD(P)H-nitrite reductase large subunit
MNECPRGADCGGCQMYGGPMICHCLQITEVQLVTALTASDLKTLREVRRRTGAGTGCNACHGRIQLYLDNYSASSAEICSAR